MNQGVPSSFLDLILSAMAGIIILNIITPFQPKKTITHIEIKYVHEKGGRKDYKPFYELNINNLIFDSGKRNDFDNPEYERSDEGLIMDIETPENEDNLKLILSIQDDYTLFTWEDTFQVLVFINEAEHIIELNANNGFCVILNESL